MSDTRPLKAYKVHDGEEGWAIVFAANVATARRRGADEIACGVDELESCDRAPEFDQYTPGPVPIGAMLDAGWWFECCGCGIQIRDGMEVEDRPELTCADALQDGAFIWCSNSCRDEDKRQQSLCTAKQGEMVESLSAEVLRRYPRAEIYYTHAYASYQDGAAIPVQVFVDFKFPGAVIGGGTMRIEHRESDDMKLFVTAGDMEAWHAYVDSLKAVEAPV